MSKRSKLQLALSRKVYTNLKNALFRVENRTYGLCKVTGKLINKERLKIVHATMRRSNSAAATIRSFKT
jgi:RNA polymerase-binding transcription factor DksA